MGLMQGKRGLIMGVANDRSLAWGIAQKLGEQGAEIAFSYQGEALEKRVRTPADSIGQSLLFECDVASDASIDQLFADLGQHWPTIDFIVHAISYSDKNELRGRYAETSRANFAMSMDISVYSFTCLLYTSRCV